MDAIGRGRVEGGRVIHFLGKNEHEKTKRIWNKVNIHPTCQSEDEIRAHHSYTFS